MDPSEEIRQLYFKATPKTIDRDFARAIDLLRGMPDEASREKMAVYMQGLAEMRREARGSGGVEGSGGAGGARKHGAGSGGKRVTPKAGGGAAAHPRPPKRPPR